MNEQLTLFETAEATASASACGCSESALCPDMAEVWREYAELWERGENAARRAEIGTLYALHRREALGLTAAEASRKGCWPRMDGTYAGGSAT